MYVIENEDSCNKNQFIVTHIKQDTQLYAITYDDTSSRLPNSLITFTGDDIIEFFDDGFTSYIKISNKENTLRVVVYIKNVFTDKDKAIEEFKSKLLINAATNLFDEYNRNNTNNKIIYTIDCTVNIVDIFNKGLV